MSGWSVETLRCEEHVAGPSLMNGWLVNVERVPATGVVKRLVQAHDRIIVGLSAGRYRAAGAERADQLLKRRRHDAGMRRRRRQRQRAVVQLVRRKLGQLVEGLPR